MKTPTVLTMIAFYTAAFWAVRFRSQCAVWGWPWWVALVAFVVVFLVILCVLLSVYSGCGAEVQR